MADGTTRGCAVVIPVYKDDMSACEEKSLRRCLEVLGGYPIIFIAPRRLDCERYKQVCSEHKLSAPVSYEFFHNKFFSGFNGYNALMLSGDFYKRFLDYKYILIYQPDAFIFGNDLAAWLERGYDYAGAPVFEVKRGDTAPTHTDFLNGGFSLRRTDFFHQHSKKMRPKIFWYLLLLEYEKLMKKRQTLNLYQKMRLLIFCSVKYLCKLLQWDIGEDFEWSAYIRKHGAIAPFDEALKFSFDSCAEYAFRLNGGSLPLGCHGWTAYYNRLFWDKYI
jgi:hypothetical protein